MADTQENNDELPELEGVAMEPAEEPMPAPVAAAPAVAADSDMFSAKDLTDDILGGADFDLPAPPPNIPVPKPPVAPKASAPSGFKSPAGLFGQSGGFGTSSLKPAPVPVPVVAKAPEPALFDALDLAPSPDAPGAKEALRAALISDAAPTALPPDAARAMFQLARVLIKKGIVTVDDLIT